ncbi:MAG TPA: chemotaxis protein CheB [Methylomirabilota bacterium]|nr:chemotaxis protein CheB [Methylomirabilota bacterium]
MKAHNNGNKRGGRGRDIIVIGTSAGGIEALTKLLGKIPKTIGAALFVVMHVAPRQKSYLPEILARNCELPVIHPKDGQGIEHGNVYIAPPDQHMLLEENRIVLIQGPKENRHRPAVDPLFRTAAKCHKEHVIGVVLTGALDDGTSGLQAIKQCGGLAVVQHPEEAFAPGMPLSAVRWVQTDYCLPLAKIRPLLLRLVKEKPEKKANGECSEVNYGINVEGKTMTPEQMQAKAGTPAPVACPECSGPLWQLKEGGTVNYRCLVGHAFSPESLLDGENEALERALWTAVKTLEERGHVLALLAERAGHRRQMVSQENWRARAEESYQQAALVRDVLKKVAPVPPLAGE